MGLMTTIRQWQSSWAQVNELNAVGIEHREALARDIALPLDVLEKLAVRGNEAAAELPRLMEALSLDAEKAIRMYPALMRDMGVTCSQCAVVTRCRRELNCGRASSVYHGYCPNAETLQELQGQTGC